MTAPVPQAAVDAADDAWLTHAPEETYKVCRCGWKVPWESSVTVRPHHEHRMREVAAAVVAAVLGQGRSRWEYGIEMSLPQWNNGEPYMEWGASVGMSHRYDYTADNVHSLASGRPVYRRMRTTFPEVIGEREPFPRPDTTTNDKD